MRQPKKGRTEERARGCHDPQCRLSHRPRRLRELQAEWASRLVRRPSACRSRGRLIAGGDPVVDALTAARTLAAPVRTRPGTMQGTVGLCAGTAEQRQYDRVEVDAAVAISMRTGKIEIRLRRGIERVRARRGRRAVPGNELQVDTDQLTAREGGRQLAGGFPRAYQLLTFLFAD